MTNNSNKRPVDDDKPGHKNRATTMLEPAQESPHGGSDSDDEAPSLVQCQPVVNSALTNPPSSSFCSPAPSPSAVASSSSNNHSSPSIPITILSGLLGAGKTTLLRSLLTGKLEHNLRILAIQNEFSLESGVEAPLRITPLRKTKKREKEAGDDAPKRSSSSVSPRMSHVSLRERDPEDDERKEHEESGAEKKDVKEKGHGSMANTETESQDSDGDDDEDDYLPESVYELPNGCICCSIKDELIRTLEAVLNRFPGKFDYVVVEASGVATPQQLIEAFWLDEPLQDQMHLDGIVTVIDPMNIPPLHGLCQVATSGTGHAIGRGLSSPAGTGTSSAFPPSASNGTSSSSQELLSSPVSSASPDTSSQPATSSSPSSSSSPPTSSSGRVAVSPGLGELWVQQVICADKILISKTDIASAEALETTVALAKSLNPVASVLPVSFKDFRRRPGPHTSPVSEEQQQKLDIHEFLRLSAYARGAATADIALLQTEKARQTRDAGELKGDDGLQEKNHSEGTVEVADDHKAVESNVTTCIRSHCISIPSHLPASRILSSFPDGTNGRERYHPTETGGGHLFHERRLGSDASRALQSSGREKIQHNHRGNTTGTSGGVSCDPPIADQVDSTGWSCQKDATCLQENEIYLFSVSKLERLLSELLWREEDQGRDVNGVPSPVIYRCKGLFLAWKERDFREEEGVDGGRNECKPCGAQLESTRLQESGNKQQKSHEEASNAEQENGRDIEMSSGRPWGVYELQGVGRTFEINSVDIACLRTMLQQEKRPRGFACKKHDVSERRGRDTPCEQCGSHLPAGDTSRTQDHGDCTVHACSCNSDSHNSGHQTRTQAGASSRGQQKETERSEVRDEGQRERLENTCCCRSADIQECQTRRILTNKFLFVGRGIDSGELSRRLRTECMQAEVLDGNVLDDSAWKS